MSGRSNRPLRVAMDGRSLASLVLRGWDRYTVGLGAELVKRGVQLTLIHRTGEPLHPEHVTAIGCEVLAVESSRGLLWEQVALPRVLRRYDIYHAPAEHGIPLWSPCPTVLTIHSVTWHSYVDLVRSGKLPGKPADYTGFEPAAWPSLYWKAQVARASHILTPSEFSREEIVRLLKVPEKKVTVTPLGVPAEFLEDSTPPTQVVDRLNIRRPYLLYVGGYELHKNVSGLLRTFALVKQKRSEISLVLVGTKPVPAVLIVQAQALGLQPDRDVFFLSDLGKELVALYDGAELFVSMSWRESFGMPVLEAMARGLRVVASEWGASREVAGELGSLADPRDCEKAAKAIVELLLLPVTPDSRAGLRANAGTFTWTRPADITLGIYSSLLGGG